MASQYTLAGGKINMNGDNKQGWRSLNVCAGHSSFTCRLSSNGFCKQQSWSHAMTTNTCLKQSQKASTNWMQNGIKP